MRQLLPAPSVATVLRGRCATASTIATPVCRRPHCCCCYYMYAPRLQAHSMAAACRAQQQPAAGGSSHSSHASPAPRLMARQYLGTHFCLCLLSWPLVAYAVLRETVLKYTPYYMYILLNNMFMEHNMFMGVHVRTTVRTDVLLYVPYSS
eukprot:COSAG01_NODE_566_length_15422_cov_8.342622_4_plen_150_part_00